MFKNNGIPTAHFNYQFCKPCPGMLRLITNLSHIDCMWQPLSPPKNCMHSYTLSSPQIHVRTRTASVGVFQRLCVHLSILSMISSVTAAACASPPAVPWTQLLPASWCGYGSTYIRCIHSQAILDARRDCLVNMKQSSDIVKVLVTSNC